MSPPYEPGHPQYPPYPPPAPPAAGLRERLGERVRLRPLPRFGVALAGAGTALAIIGVLVWGVDFLAGGFATSSTAFGGGSVDSRRLLGAALALAVTAVGYLLVARNDGPLAAAGVAASALGVPVLMSFLTIEPSRLSFSADPVVLVSLLAWSASYLLFPRTRGHVFYLGLATYVLWLYVLDKVAPSALGRAVSTSVVTVGGAPDWTSVGAVSLLFGLGYYVFTFALDRSGYAGAATGFVVAAFAATVGGVAALAAQFGQAGTGVLLVVLGAVLAWFAARSARRFTTWAWCAAVAVGIVLVVADAIGTAHASAAGIVLIVIGACVVAIAHVVSGPATGPGGSTLPR